MFYKRCTLTGFCLLWVYIADYKPAYPMFEMPYGTSRTAGVQFFSIHLTKLSETMVYINPEFRFDSQGNYEFAILEIEQFNQVYKELSRLDDIDEEANSRKVRNEKYNQQNSDGKINMIIEEWILNFAKTPMITEKNKVLKVNRILANHLFSGSKNVEFKDIPSNFEHFRDDHYAFEHLHSKGTQIYEAISYLNFIGFRFDDNSVERLIMNEDDWVKNKLIDKVYYLLKHICYSPDNLFNDNLGDIQFLATLSYKSSLLPTKQTLEFSLADHSLKKFKPRNI